jgi:hypothetical protein
MYDDRRGELTWEYTTGVESGSGKIPIMPLSGGAADKFGNRYEGRWTVNCMTDVMDERADAIRLEPPGAEGEGCNDPIRLDHFRAVLPS